MSKDIGPLILSLLKELTLFRDRTGDLWIAKQTGELRFSALPLDPRRSDTRAALGRLLPGVNRADWDEIFRAFERFALASPPCDVHVRCAHMHGQIFVDLGYDDLSVLRITEESWAIEDCSPTTPPFRRSKGFLPLPVPRRNHESLLQELCHLFPLLKRGILIKICAFLIGGWHAGLPLPVLEIVGPQGSAKSTLAKFIRALLDPNTAPSRRVSREERDLFISALNCWLQSLENVSSIAPWVSDALCTMATGGSFVTRTLFKNTEETIIAVRRPVMVNGIHEVILRPDLRERALTVRLPQLDESQRRTEAEIWKKFEAARPGILGALCDCVADGLLMEPYLTLSHLPRMADWYRFVYAAAESDHAGFSPAEFAAEYQHGQNLAHQIGIDASPIGRPLFKLLEGKRQWTGTLSHLLGMLNNCVAAKDRASDWPKTPEAFRHALDRIVPDFQKEGITVEFFKASTKKRERTVKFDFSDVE